MRLIFAFLLVASVPGIGRADDPPRKQAPVVLDAANLAKLREVAFQAAREGDARTITAYLNAGQPANIVNARGDSLLTLAAYHEHEAVVRLILDRPGVAVDARNAMGFTALTGAAFKGNLAIARRLVAKGADVNAANARGQTPLMFASMFGRKDVVAFLLQAHANPSVRDDRGQTARSLAEAQGATEIVALLKAAEATPAKATARP